MASEKKKVAVNILSSKSGGALAYVRNMGSLLSEELSARGIQMTILARKSQRNSVPAALLDQTVFLNLDGRSGWRRHLWEIRNIPRILHANDIDVLFTPYQIGVTVRGIRSVGMVRNMEPFFHERFKYDLSSRLRNIALRWETRRFLKAQTKIVAVSRFAGKISSSNLGIDSAKFTTIYHGRDSEFSPAKAETASEMLAAYSVPPQFIFTAGSLFPYRRLEDIIRGVSKCSSGMSGKLSLVVAGDGSDQAYARKIAAETESGRSKIDVISVGHADIEVMRALYASCAVFIMASEVEACPNIAIEAMSSGCKVLSADVPVLREMFGNAASYYTPRDCEDLAQQLRGLLEGELGIESKSLERAADFSWAKCAHETADLLEGVLS